MSSPPPEPDASNDQPADDRSDLPTVDDVVDRLDRLWANKKLPPVSPFATSAGTKIGDYVIERVIGRGGFGIVYKAHDQKLNRDVALKIPRPEVLLDESNRKRFEAEALATAKLDHPAIIPLYEAEIECATPYLASAYCPGPNLQQWLDDRSGPLPPRDAAEFLAQLADAVQFAHDHGVIHRDLKPSNILLMPISDSPSSEPKLRHYQPRLTDFGLSQFVERSQVTCSTIRIGTPLYMSPEQTRGQTRLVDVATDVYSLGVILYVIVTGRPPFTGASEFDMLQQIVQSEPSCPEKSGVPRDLSSICLKCLEKDPSTRYPSATDLRRDLQRFINGQPTEARPVNAFSKAVRWARRFPARASLASLVCLTVIATITGLSLHLRVINQQTAAMSDALQDVKTQREAARAALHDADVAREIADSQRTLARQTSYRSNMRLAFEQFKAGQRNAVDDLLASQIPTESQIDFRGPEWFALNAELKSRCQVLGSHLGGVTECVLSTDRGTAWTAGVDGRVKIWNLRTGSREGEFDARIGEIHAMALSSDGKMLAIGGSPRLFRTRVRIVDPRTGERRSDLQSHKTTIESIQFSADGRWLAAGSRYHPVQLTRLSDGTTFTLSSDRRNRTISFTADSQHLAVVSSKSAADVYAVDGAAPVRKKSVSGYRDSSPYILAFAPTQPLLATSDVHVEYITLTRQPDNQLQALIRKPGLHQDQSRFKALAFSPNSDRLAAGDESGTILVWDTALGGDAHLPARLSSTLSFTPHQSGIASLQFVDGHRILSVSEDGLVCLTNFTGSGTKRCLWQGLHVVDVAVGDTSLWMACSDETIRRCDNPFTFTFGAEDEPFQRETKAAAHPKIVMKDLHNPTCICLSPDDKTLAVGSDSAGVKLFDTEAGTLLATVAADRAGDGLEIDDMTFSANGRRLAYTGTKALTHLYDVTTEASQRTPLAEGGYAVRFLNEDEYLAMTFGRERVDVVALKHLEVVRSLPGAGRMMTVSPDGKVLLIGHFDGRLSFFNLDDQSIKTVPAHRKGIECGAISADGHTVITVDWAGGVTFTDTQTATVLGRLHLPGDRTYHADNTSVMCDSRQLLILRSTTNADTLEAATTEVYSWQLAP